MPFVHVRDIDVYYEISGSGPRLLAIPGSGADLRVNSLAATLAGRFEVLTYDQRGLGRTSRPPGPYTMAGYAEDAAALLAALHWERCHVLGVSFGGMVAQELAIRYPRHVQRLVLACWSDPSGGRRLARAAEIYGLRRAAVLSALASDSGSGPSASTVTGVGTKPEVATSSRMSGSVGSSIATASPVFKCSQRIRSIASSAPVATVRSVAGMPSASNSIAAKAISAASSGARSSGSNREIR